ncbi:MAG: acetyl-CoA carboxylase, carboxyltransferase subunit beta [Chloroflexota bacterium]|nr:acetyl-CoA carboxylase, carboxyltransferase subunit beta [Chloroflexota bacterium]
MREILRRPRLPTRQGKSAADKDREFPDDIWTKCPKCNELLYVRELENNLHVCHKCGYHFRLTSIQRIEYLLDPESFREEGKNITPVDAIGFQSLDQKYSTKLKETQSKTGLNDALVYGMGLIEEVPVIAAVVDFRFLGGSMGSVYGEKLVRAAEMARKKKVGLLTVSSSGGARMQEGIYSLMQMAKTNSALAGMAEARLPHISLLTDPCTGGVTASYASTADVVMAEPGALIGFAGPRVIEQTIKQKLPPDFQSAEFQLKHGMLDMIVPRRELRSTISKLLKLYINTREGD